MRKGWGVGWEGWAGLGGGFGERWDRGDRKCGEVSEGVDGVGGEERRGRGRDMLVLVALDVPEFIGLLFCWRSEVKRARAHLSSRSYMLYSFCVVFTGKDVEHCVLYNCVHSIQS